MIGHFIKSSLKSGSDDGGRTEKGAEHQRSPGEDEEEHGADHQGPSDASGRGGADRSQGRQEADPEAREKGKVFLCHNYNVDLCVL